MYIQNYSTATSTCLSIRRWLFSINRELTLLKDPLATTYIFWQVTTPSFLPSHISVNYLLYSPGRWWRKSRLHSSWWTFISTKSSARLDEGARISPIGPWIIRLWWCCISTLSLWFSKRRTRCCRRRDERGEIARMQRRWCTRITGGGTLLGQYQAMGGGWWGDGVLFAISQAW